MTRHFCIRQCNLKIFSNLNKTVQVSAKICLFGLSLQTQVNISWRTKGRRYINLTLNHDDFWNLLCLLDSLLLCFFERIEICDSVLLHFENKSKQCKQEINRFRITNVYTLTKYFLVIPKNELSGKSKALFNYKSIAYIVHHPIGYYELMFKLFYAFKQELVEKTSCTTQHSMSYMRCWEPSRNTLVAGVQRTFLSFVHCCKPTFSRLWSASVILQALKYTLF